ncbi:UNVERIFIED_CONTAM: hypothetical protein Sindi_0933100 [Sesamum indicum]
MGGRRSATVDFAQVGDVADLCEVAADMAGEAVVERDDDIISDAGLIALADGVTADAVTASVADGSNDIIQNSCMQNSIPSAVARAPKGLFVGNIELHASPDSIIDDKIAHAFHNSTRKTFLYVAPTVQNGEVIMRPTLDIIRTGSKRWKATAVGYFLGKRPYFYHLKEYAVSTWPGLREVPVWIILRYLPVELWREDGLSTVASGVGKPLYPDAITRACTRLDFARVDVEYEWVPLKCTNCMTLGHAIKECPLNKATKPVKPPVAVYMAKMGAPRAPPMQEQGEDIRPPLHRMEEQTSMVRDPPYLKPDQASS